VLEVVVSGLLTPLSLELGVEVVLEGVGVVMSSGVCRLVLAIANALET
jgi:hypothetical protein